MAESYSTSRIFAEGKRRDECRRIETKRKLLNPVISNLTRRERGEWEEIPSIAR